MSDVEITLAFVVKVVSELIPFDDNPAILFHFLLEARAQLRKFKLQARDFSVFIGAISFVITKLYQIIGISTFRFAETLLCFLGFVTKTLNGARVFLTLVLRVS